MKENKSKTKELEWGGTRNKKNEKKKQKKRVKQKN
jgi:hypothetical protein